jgi:uncharacterized membrane protein YoaK (UPF0700 family)
MASAGASTWHVVRLAAGLAMIAGYIDAYGLIRYQTYLSFMSGNTTQTGSQLGQGHLALAIPSFIAIAFFFTGVFAGTLLAQGRPMHATRLRFILVAALLAVTIALSRAGSIVPDLAIAMLALAMGMMNTVLSHVGGQSLNIGFVTGTLNSAGQHLAQAVLRAPLPDAQGARDTHASRAALLLCLWLAFLSGALIAGFATSRFDVGMLLPACLAVSAIALWNPTLSTSDHSR